jgi:hypothetical protein
MMALKEEVTTGNVGNLLEQILDSINLGWAVDRVVSNKGAPGIGRSIQSRLNPCSLRMVEAMDLNPWTFISSLENPSLLRPASKVMSEIGLSSVLILVNKNRV